MLPRRLAGTQESLSYRRYHGLHRKCTRGWFSRCWHAHCSPSSSRCWLGNASHSRPTLPIGSRSSASKGILDGTYGTFIRHGLCHVRSLNMSAVLKKQRLIILQLRLDCNWLLSCLEFDRRLAHTTGSRMCSSDRAVDWTTLCPWYELVLGDDDFAISNDMQKHLASSSGKGGLRRRGPFFKDSIMTLQILTTKPQKQNLSRL